MTDNKTEVSSEETRKQYKNIVEFTEAVIRDNDEVAKQKFLEIDPNVIITPKHVNDVLRKIPFLAHLSSDYNTESLRPLFLAAFNKRTELIKFMVEHGADIDMPHVKTNASLMHFAIVNEDEE
ncbi:MAG: hypothetical protein DGJ47_001197, partial [Rickettsiaceae bacterium]